MNCLRCGTQIAENALFCDNCKKTVSEPLKESAYLNTQILLPVRKAQPPRPAQTKPSRKTESKPEEEAPRGKGRLVLLTVLCLLLLAGALYLGTRWILARRNVASLREQTAALERQTASLEVENAALDGQLAALNGQTAALQEQTASLEEKNAALQEQVASLEQDRTALQRTLDFIDENAAFLPYDGKYLYHTGGCTHYEKTGFLVYNVSTAIALGYEPCPYCHPSE